MKKNNIVIEKKDIFNEFQKLSGLLQVIKIKDSCKVGYNSGYEQYLVTPNDSQGIYTVVSPQIDYNTTDKYIFWSIHSYISLESKYRYIYDAIAMRLLVERCRVNIKPNDFEADGLILPYFVDSEYDCKGYELMKILEMKSNQLVNYDDFDDFET